MNSKYDNKIFAEGVRGVLRATWKLQLITPLAIRNGLSIKYSEPKASKSRGLRLRFKWQELEAEDSDYELAALHFGYEVVADKLQAFHFVPASSVRGALRSWTINHLVHPKYRQDMNPPEHDDDPEEKKQKAYLKIVQEALDDPTSGYGLMANLFGLAFETRKAAKEMAHAGRLRVQTEKFANAQARPIAINGVLEEGMVGPRNANRQMTVRNPLDRMTHASKEGGLHHFLEFCAGETFLVRLNILNPKAQDLGLFSLWARELNEGMLRFGALASIGRGRVAIAEQSYRLWQRANLSPLADFTPVSNETSNDVLAGLWREYELPSEKLATFEQHLPSFV